MFNLIVSGAGWQPHRDSFSRDRVLEFTDAAIVQRFMPNEVLDRDAVSRLPTLFMSETQWDGNQVAHVGTITQLRLSDKKYQIEYAFDPTIRPIPNSSLLRMAGELGIDQFEFRRIHWAIKEADLYKALLRNIYSNLPMPRVFQLSPEPADHRLVSAMMPFSAGFDGVYAALGVRPRRLEKSAEGPMTFGITTRSSRTWLH